MVTVMRLGGLSDLTIALGLDQLILYVSAAAFEDGLLQHGEMSDEEMERYFAEVHAIAGLEWVSASSARGA
jgi:hypothetical protein